jgi:hypothetical protein
MYSEMKRGAFSLLAVVRVPEQGGKELVEGWRRESAAAVLIRSEEDRVEEEEERWGTILQGAYYTREVL